MTSSPWPTGPIADTSPPTPEAAAPTVELLDCPDPDCPSCKVADAGAAVIAAAAGVPADHWPGMAADVRAHYRAIAAEVYAAMSQALIDTGLVEVPQ